MSGHEENKRAQTSSYSTKTRDINTNYSYYDWHYNQPFYVDKTLLIKQIVDMGHNVLYAPPGFGKTLNMDMVRRFVEIEVDENGKPIELDVDEDKCCLKEVQTRSKNFKLFEGKKIFEYKQFVFKHFGKYPTIHVDFSELVGYDFEEILVKFRKLLHKAFRQHAYLENSSFFDDGHYEKNVFMWYADPVKCASLDKNDVEFGLDRLAGFLCGYYGKEVYLFIDGLDVPVNTMIYQNLMTTEDKEKTLDLLQFVTTNLLKENQFVDASLCNASQKFSHLVLEHAINVRHGYFMYYRFFREFYGLEESEVKYLLEKAGRLGDFDKIKENYKAYKTTSSDGRDIEIYNTWVIINFLKTGHFDFYLPASILHKMKELIDHPIIRYMIVEIMSEEFIRIQYDNCLRSKMDEIESLSDILFNSKVVACQDSDLFIQFLTELGFFQEAEKYEWYLFVGIRNRKVYSMIDEILGSIDSVKKHYNHSPELIENFVESLEDLARLRTRDAVYALAENINVLLGSGTTLRTTYELQSVLHAYMLQKFKHVSAECRIFSHRRYDAVLVIAHLHVMFIIEYKEYYGVSNVTHQEILDKGYDTLVEKASLEKLFPKDTPTIGNIIYLEIRMDRDDKISITYSFDNTEPKNIVFNKSIKK